MSEKNIFKVLNEIDVNEHAEEKNGLTYLSWAWAWAETKKEFPEANYTIYENENGWNYFTDGNTCWVKTGVTINGLEHIEYLPVMDHRNKSIPVDKVTSFDVNKSIQRSLTKAIARHGLGLYIYTGEDLPEDTRTPEDKIAGIKSDIEKLRIDTSVFLEFVGNKFGKEYKSVDEFNDKAIEFALKSLEQKKKYLREEKKESK